MPSVDNRVVEMRFDNNDFEADVSESINSIDRLKNALKFKDASDGFDEVSRAADALTNKFSILGTIGDQILRNIGNQIYAVKDKMVGLIKSMSTDQISAGMTKYEQKTASVQTILNSTGLSIDKVNEYLDRLMKYSDETSFGFTDMTAALQTMTSAGGDLDVLIPMLMGIGNATAYAGKSAAEFSRVIYNLNQAYSMGYLGTMDWRSIEMAGVNSKQLKQLLLDTARELGTGDYAMEEFQTALTKKVFTKEVMEKTFGKFAEVTLEAEKLWKDGVYDTFSEAYEALEKRFLGTGNAYDEVAYKAAKAAQEAKTFTEAIDATKDAVSSGWMETFNILIGDYDKAKETWTWLANELWDAFASGAEKRNEMLREWSSKGGFDALWQSIRNLWDGLMGIKDRISNAWKQIFPGINADKLVGITNKLLTFSEKFKNAFAVIDETLEPVIETAKRAHDRLKPLFEFSDDIPEDSILGGMEELPENVKRIVKAIQQLEEVEPEVWAGKYGVGEERFKALQEEGYSWEYVQNAVNETAGSTHRYEISQEDLAMATAYLNGELVLEGDSASKASSGVDNLGKSAEKSGNWISNLKDVLGGFKSALDLLVGAGKLAFKYLVMPAWNGLVKIFKAGLAVLAPFSRAFSEFVQNLKEANTVERTIWRIQSWFRALWEYLETKENFKKFLGYLEQFKSWASSIKNSALDKIRTFFDNLVHLNIRLPNLAKVGDWIDDIVGFFNNLIESANQAEGFWPTIKSFFEGLDFSGVESFASSLATGISTFFQTLFKDNELKETGKGWLKAIWEGIKEEAKKADFGEVISLLFKGISLAPLVMLGTSISKFFWEISKIPEGSFDILAQVERVLSSFAWKLKGEAFKSVAIGVGILAASMAVLSYMDQDNLANVAVSLSVVILSVSVLIKVLGSLLKGGNIKQSATQVSKLAQILVGLGVAFAGLSMGLVGFALAIAAFALIPEERLVKALVSIGAIIGIFTAFIALTTLIYKIPHGGTSTDLIKTAAAFAILSLALDLILPAIISLTGVASIPGTKIWSAIGAIAAIIAAFSVLTVASKRSNNIAEVGASFLIAAIAIDVMAIGLIQMANAAKKGSDLFSGVLAIIALVTVFGFAIGILSALNQTSKIDSGIKAMLAMAAGVVAIGAVLYALKGTTFKDAISVLGAIALFVAAFTAIGAVAGHWEFIATGMLLVGSAVAILGAGVLLAGVGVLAFAKALDILAKSSTNAKQAGRDLGAGVGAFFDELNKNKQPIIDFFSDLILAILGVIVLYKSDITNKGAELLDALMDGLIKGVKKGKGKLFLALGILLVGLLDYLGVNTNAIIKGALAVVIQIINGLTRAIIEEGPELGKAIGRLGAALANMLGKIFGFALQNFVNNIVESEAEKGRAGGGYFSNIVRVLSSYANWLTEENELDKKILTGLDESDVITNNWIKESGDNIVQTSEDYKSKAEEAAENISSGNNAWVNKFLSAKDSVNIGDTIISGEVLKNLQERLTNGDLSVDQLMSIMMRRAGESATENGDFLITSVDGVGEDTVVSLFESFGFTNGNTAASDLLKSLGAAVPDNVAEGIEENVSEVEDSATNIGEVMEAGTATIKDDMYLAGKQAALGFALGLLDHLQFPKAASHKMAMDVIDECKMTIDAHSPARAFEKLGQTVPSGFALGISEQSFMGVDAARDLGDDTLNAFNSVIKRIFDAIDGDFDMSPVIRPVLDLSEIQNGQARIGSLLGMSTYAFSPNVGNNLGMANDIVAATGQMSIRGANTNSLLGSLQMKIDQLNQDNATIVSVISRYLPYVPEIANMDVVMDSGTLVGKLAPGMNKKLGTIAATSYRRRR